MMMVGVFGLIFQLLIVAVLALGLAFLLDVKARRLSMLSRSMISAFLAVFLPLLILVVVILGLSEGANPVLTLVPLVIWGLVLALLVGFPIAYFFSRRRERARNNPVNPDVFE